MWWWLRRRKAGEKQARIEKAAVHALLPDLRDRLSNQSINQRSLEPSPSSNTTWLQCPFIIIAAHTRMSGLPNALRRQSFPPLQPRFRSPGPTLLSTCMLLAFCPCSTCVSRPAFPTRTCRPSGTPHDISCLFISSSTQIVVVTGTLSSSPSSSSFQSLS